MADGLIDIFQFRAQTANLNHPTSYNSKNHKYAVLDDCAAVKASGTSILCAPIGGFLDVDDMERILAEGKADMIAGARMFIADFEFYDKNRTGKLMSRLTGDLFEITELAHHGPEDLVISVLTITGALIAMYTMEWRLATVVAVLLPLFTAVGFLGGRCVGFTRQCFLSDLGARGGFNPCAFRRVWWG